MSVLVVPPNTPGGTARAVLRSAAGADSTATTMDILTSNGVPPQKNPAATIRPETTEGTPEQRWEAEGGYVRNDRHASPTSVR